MMKKRSYIFIAVFIIAVFIMTNNLINADSRDEKATFAGGCFWCMEAAFEVLSGVISATAGYTGGKKDNPDYMEVSSGETGHLEAVEVTYDPSKVSYDKLLDYFWKQIDPTDAEGQFADKGTQYKTAIFYHSQGQKRLAEESKEALQASGKFEKPIATQILKASGFFPAEEYHQDYYKKNPVHYNNYKIGSGRAGFIKKTWGDENAHGQDVKEKQRTAAVDKVQKTIKKYEKPSQAEVKKRLTPQQYEVTQQCSTEPPFKNAYWDNKREGIYVDIVSGEPLFSSSDKFASGTGWPSFTKPIESDSIVERPDTNLGMQRTEVRSKYGDSHLGHVFDDGPGPDGLRYCINSSSLRFIPKEGLEEEGYGEYLRLFKE